MEPRRHGAFRRHKFFFLSLSPAVRTPLRRCGWAGWPSARSDGAADGPESRASWWLHRMMSCVDVCETVALAVALAVQKCRAEPAGIIRVHFAASRPTWQPKR